MVKPVGSFAAGLIGGVNLQGRLNWSAIVKNGKAGRFIGRQTNWRYTPDVAIQLVKTVKPTGSLTDILIGGINLHGALKVVKWQMAKPVGSLADWRIGSTNLKGR